MQPKNAFNCNISLMLRKHVKTIFISVSVMIERELVEKLDLTNNFSVLQIYKLESTKQRDNLTVPTLTGVVNPLGSI